MRLKFITWNLWNSFKRLGPFFEIEYLEPYPRILKRRKMQDDLLSQAKEEVDLFFLQEVNPLRKRLKNWTKDFPHAQYQVDQGGVKFYGFGPPFFFENALVFLSHHQLRNLGKKKLSPQIGWNQNSFSFQWQELRYAHFCELNLYEKRILVVNTHLHHGIEWTSALKKDLESALKKGEIKEKEFYSLLEYISFSTARKKKELESLLSEVEAKRKHYHYVVIGGDFNFSEDSPYLDVFSSHGFKRATLKQAYSWHNDINKKNHHFSNQMPPPVKELSPGVALNILKEHNLRNRNIDHFFVSDSINIIQLEAFACESERESFLPSDHIGVKMEIEL